MDAVTYCDLKREFDRAVRAANIDVMRSCFALNDKVARDEDRRTGLIPLVTAVQPDALSIADNVNVLQLLIGEFCSPIADPPSGRYGNNILHWLVLYHRVSLLEWALNQDFCRSDIVNSLNNDGHTPLHLAVHSGQSALYAALLHHGASPNVMGAGGNAPLHVATQHLDYVCAQLLVARDADVNARNAAGETPLMTLFLPYVDTGFRLSTTLRSTSQEAKEQTMILPILEFLVAKGADVRLETRCRLHSPSSLPLVSAAMDIGLAPTTTTTTPSDVDVVVHCPAATLVSASALRLALHYGFARAAERLSSEEKSLSRFEWLQRPVDVDPFRPFVVLICDSDEDVRRVFHQLDLEECCGAEIVASKRRSPSPSGAAAAATTFISSQREELVEGLLAAQSRILHGTWRQGEDGAAEARERLNDGVTHVVTLRRRPDDDIECNGVSTNQRATSVPPPPKVPSHSFVVDCLTRHSTLTPHLLRALAISVPPLIVYFLRNQIGFSEVQDEVLSDIRSKITQIVEASSLKNPLPLLKASVLICMMEDEEGNDADAYHMPSEVALFNVIEKTKSYFSSPSADNGGLNCASPNDPSSSSLSSALEVEFLHDFRNGGGDDDLFVLSTPSSWLNLRKRLVLYRRRLIQALPSLTNLAKEILVDTESMNLPPAYETFEDVLHFVRGQMHPLVTDGMVLETLKTLEIRGEALFLDAVASKDDDDDDDAVNSNLNGSERGRGEATLTALPSGSSTVLISPFSGLNSNRLCLGSGCFPSKRGGVNLPPNSNPASTSALSSSSKPGRSVTKSYVDLSALLSAGVASSYVLQRIFAKESSLTFNIRLHPSLSDFEWRFDPAAEAATTTTTSSMTSLSRVYRVVDEATNCRKKINPLLVPLLCSALSSRSLNDLYSSSAASSTSGTPGSVVSKLSGSVAWVQDTLSMSESCFVLSKDYTSLIILTRSLSGSSSSTMLTASAYEKFKSDVNYCVNLCLDTLHGSRIEWRPLDVSRHRCDNALRLSELDGLCPD